MSLIAQNKYPDYYSGRSSVKGRNTTYMVQRINSSLAIYNSSNKYDPEKKFYRVDGTQFSPGANLIQNTYFKAFNFSFSLEREETLFLNYDYPTMMITYIVDTSNGNTLEVRFLLYNDTCDLEHSIFSIEPEEIEIFERNLKQYVKWEVGNSARDVPYCVMSQWAVSPSKMKDNE